MKNSVILILVALGVSCSGTKLVHHPRYERMQASQDDKSRPAFFLGQFQPKTASGRAPASVESENPERLSPKTMYFFALWKQKRSMEKALELETSQYCPAFHHSLLEAGEDGYASLEEYSLDKDWAAIARRDDPVAEPVLALPLDGADLYSALVSQSGEDKELAREKAVSAFEGFYQRAKDEVEELCETGASKGYYTFLNMLTHYASDSGFMNSEEALPALLKLSPVANYYVLQSLKTGRAPASGAVAQERVLRELNAIWFKDYVERANKEAQAWNK